MVCMMKALIGLGKVKRKASFISFMDLVEYLRKRFVYNNDFLPDDD